MSKFLNIAFSACDWPIGVMWGTDPNGRWLYPGSRSWPEFRGGEMDSVLSASDPDSEWAEYPESFAWAFDGSDFIKFSIENGFNSLLNASTFIFQKSSVFSSGTFLGTVRFLWL